jgi:hypothetical protein
MNKYELLTTVRTEAEFYDVEGNLVDPVPLTFKFKTPGGVITTYTYGTNAQIVRRSLGRYTVDVLGNEAGVWYYRYNGGNTPQTSIEEQFFINASVF